MCTQQYGGPQVAVVTGTFHGRPVHSRFSLTDGCEIARWRSMAPLFGGTPGILRPDLSAQAQRTPAFKRNVPGAVRPPGRPC